MTTQEKPWWLRWSCADCTHGSKLCDRATIDGCVPGDRCGGYEAKEAEPEVAYWTHDDCGENLSYEDLDEAIDAALEYWYPDEPETLTMYGFARIKLTVKDCGPVLDDLLLYLDEEYGHEEDDATEATPAMLAAEKAFLAVVLAEYVPWRCEQVCTREIVVAE